MLIRSVRAIQSLNYLKNNFIDADIVKSAKTALLKPIEQRSTNY